MIYEEQLTELQYSDDRKGPFKLYIYGPDGYHSGSVCVVKKGEEPEDPTEITVREMMVRTLEAATRGLEVRITDLGDMLVYHCKGSQVLHPKPIGDFWKEITREVL